MTEHEASRTLVKSAPELWAQCSDAASLSRHLEQFGEIRITRLEPETTVAWEGELASGTVRLEPAGWGTKVVVTARSRGIAPVPAQPPPEPIIARRAPAQRAPDPVEAAPPPPPPPPPAPEPARRGVFARMARFFAPRRPPTLPAEPPALAAEPAPPPAALERPAPEPAAPEPAPAPPPAPDPLAGADAALAAALDSLGQAHHRPFSRA